MPVPLHINNTTLARAAGGRVTRLASMLLAAERANEPMMVSTHVAGGPFALGHLLNSDNPLGQWMRNHAAQAPVARAAPILGGSAEAPAQAPRTILSPIADIYRSLRTGGTPEHRVRTSDEQLESLNPAGAGKTASVVRLGLDDAASSRESDLLLLTAGVVRYCFGDDARSLDGQFDATVFSHLQGAADIIAPGARLSAMSQEQIHAIVTTAIESSNSEFLRQLRSQAGIPSSVAQAAAAADAPRGKGAEQFMKDGRFDPETFRTKTQAGALDAMRLMASSPATIKVGLLAVAAEKASQLLADLPERQRSLSDLTQRIGNTLRARAAQRDENNLAERPARAQMVPGA